MQKTNGAIAQTNPTSALPAWLPDNVRNYLIHTEAGLSIRDLARRADCHASTILRQIRRVEHRRDDPLVDAVLTVLAGVATLDPLALDTVLPPVADPVRLHDEARRVLRRLCESGAVLAVAEGMEKAVVVRDSDAGAGMRTAVVDRDIAGALALNDWISGLGGGRVRRYGITAAGRGALNRLLAEHENAARSEYETGMAEAPGAFAGKPVDRDPASGPRMRRARYGTVESPLMALARRRDRDGSPFLSEDLVRAGERLREDFETAQTGPRVTQDWQAFLTAGSDAAKPAQAASGGGAEAAAARVRAALADLGPGLGDVALRCCCLLEGLETAERRMGWSARSGKIVLRIALQRLKLHYQAPEAQVRLIG
ncbi:MAG: DUF6456 domain-containing protein [Marinibacterium sp.]